MTSAAANAGRVLVLGDHRQTVTVVRSLARAGYEVTLGAARLPSSTAVSRYVTDVWVYEASSPQRFCNHVEAFVRSERPDYVFAVGEWQLRALLERGPHLQALTTWVNPDFATVAACFDTRGLYALLPRLGIPAAPSTAFTSAEDWREQARAMGFPVLVREGDKALMFRDAAGFEAFLASLPRAADRASLLLRKFVPGVRHKCHIGAADGRLVAYFEQKALRSQEAVAPTPELRTYCEALTSALRYTGIGCVQFVVDERSGRASFVELDAHLDRNAALPYRMGLDYPLLALQLAAYRKASAAGRPGIERLVPRHPETYAAGRALGSHHLSFDWRDPLPALHLLCRRFAHLLRLRAAA